MKKTTIYLPEILAISVSAAAKRSGNSEAALIREAIASYVAALNQPMPKTVGIVSSGELQSEDVDRWIVENWRPE